MDIVIAGLKSNLADQEEKLVAVREEEEEQIRAGQQAQERVNAQVRHVAQLQEAIRVLEADRESRMREER